ncbi:MAG: CoA-binding protein [Planctomycetaceae bacterium]|nr:CoA-binding protein [Planctomycetaceae bacterium]
MSKPSVAIVGASSDREKYGNKSIRAHLKHGYEVFPINPKGGTIEGLSVYRSLAELPNSSLDRISLYVSPDIGQQLLEQIAAIDCKELWFNPGSESEAVLDQARGLGLKPIVGCSIVDLGSWPDEFVS